jgi:gliding motility-associated-like protein
MISGNVGAVDIDWDQDQYDGQQDLGNLPPGNYSAVIMDASGCSLPIGPITIIDPEPISIACEVLNDVSNTFAMDGAAQGIVTGGTGPYEVILRRFVGMASINDTTLINTADTVLYTDLVGSAPVEQAYEFVVIDANGCRDTCAFSIFEPPCPNIFFDEVITDAACPGDSSGVISVTVINGQAPFTYQWTPTQPDTNVITNLLAGDYQLVVIDSFGCSVANLFTVNEPTSVPTLSCMALTDETSPGAANGTAQVTVMGDRPPFTVDVFGPTPSSQQLNPAGNLNLNMLAAGNYGVIVTDSSGCTTDTCFFEIVVGACTLQVNATITPEDCAGPGQIALEVLGGTMPYTFDWDVDIYDGQDTISAPTGIYAVVVTDAAGCTATTKESIGIIDNAPQLTIAGNMLACLNDSARLELQPSGGLPGYTYFFTSSPASVPLLATSSADTIIAFPIPPGTGNMFSITVDSLVDANGCVTLVDETLDYVVNPPDSLVFDDLLCSGDTVTLEGIDFFDGNPSDTFFVNSGSCGLLYLVDFDFEVAVVDTIAQTLCPEDSLIVGGVIFNGNNLEGLVNFGVPPAGGCDSSVYVRIDYLPVSTGSFTTSACEGDTIFVEDDFYTIDDPTGTTILDNASVNGCDSLLFVSVNFQPTAQVSLAGNASVCRGDTVELEFESLQGGPFTVNLLDSEGNSYSFSNVSNGSTFELMPTISTIYTLVNATQGGPGCPIDFGGNFSVEVSQLSASLTAGQDFFDFQISCNGAMDGSLAVTVNEGVPPFTYLWSDSVTTRVRNELGPGNYVVTVTDSVGCQQTYAEDLQEPAPVLFDPQVIPPGCNESDGFLILDTIRGGVPPYELTVDGDFFQVVSNFPYQQQLPPGDYTLLIRDMADCTEELPLFIPEPADPELLLIPDTLIFLGDSLFLNAQTNFNPDSILWEPQALVTAANSLSTFAAPTETTRFFLTVSDTTGCRATANILVSVDENVPIYVPTGFSPNTDGANDIFSVYGNRGVERVNVFRIFNRWGEMVFEELDFDIENPTIGWDGKHRGEDINSQVLVYYVNATLTDGRVVELKGDLTLVR